MAVLVSMTVFTVRNTSGPRLWEREMGHVFRRTAVRGVEPGSLSRLHFVQSER